MSLQEKRHVKAILELERAEKKLAAAFARWSRLRAKVKRYDLKADKKFGEEIPGKFGYAAVPEPMLGESPEAQAIAREYFG